MLARRVPPVLWLAALLVSTAGGQSVTPAPVPGTGRLQPNAILPDTVPFQVWRGLVLVSVVLNDGLPQSAALATSLPICLFSAALAGRAGTPGGGVSEVRVWDRPVKVATLKPVPLRVGRVGLTGVNSGVLDVYQHMAGTTEARAPGVWLGSSFLAATSFTIDPSKNQVTFRPVNAGLPRGVATLPLEVEGGQLWVQASVNGKPFRALLDTASLGTLIPARVARDAGLTAAASVPVVLGDNKVGKAAVADVKELGLGSASLEDVQALFIEDPAGLPQLQDFGVIGNDVLLRYRVTVSYSERKLVLEKVKLPTAPKPPPATTTAPQKPRTERPAATGTAR